MGYNMSIGGGVDLTREPRNGRNFEYAGEDPVLAGTMVGELTAACRPTRSWATSSTTPSTTRKPAAPSSTSNIDQRACAKATCSPSRSPSASPIPPASCAPTTRTPSPPGGTDWSCENDYLLNQVLKKDCGFKGFVVSDWGGTHSTVHAALAGLDQEMPGTQYFGDPLKASRRERPGPHGAPRRHGASRPAHHVRHRHHRRSARQPRFPIPSAAATTRAHRRREHRAAEERRSALLPLNAASIQSIAVIGSHADVGVLSGGGSAQVDAPGGNVASAHPHPGRRPLDGDRLLPLLASERNSQACAQREGRVRSRNRSRRRRATGRQLPGRHRLRQPADE